MTTLVLLSLVIIPSFITIALTKYYGAPLRLDPDLKTLSLSLFFSELPFLLAYIFVGLISSYFFDIKILQPIFWISANNDYHASYSGVIKWIWFLIAVYIVQVIFIRLFICFFKSLINNKKSTHGLITALDRLEIIDEMKMIFTPEKDISLDLKQGDFIYAGTFEKSIRNWFGKNMIQLGNVFRIKLEDADDTVENLIENKKIDSKSILPKMLFDLDKIDNINFQLNTEKKSTPINEENKTIIADKLQDFRQKTKAKSHVD